MEGVDPKLLRSEMLNLRQSKMHRNLRFHLNMGNLIGMLRLGPTSTRYGYGDHSMSPVGSGAKPKPDSILVNFRTKMTLIYMVQFNLPYTMLKNFTKFSIEGGMLTMTFWPIQKQILLILLQQTLGA